MGKLLSKKAEELVEKQSQVKYASFVWDENEVFKIKDFEFFKISDNLAGLGLILPKEKDVYDKKNNFEGREQVCVPVIITSDNQLYELSKGFQRKHKIKFLILPDETGLVRRWSLPSIKNYLDGKAERIEGLSLFNRIKDTYKKYYYFHNDNWYNIHSLWDIATHFYLLFKYFPIMELRGNKRTGKTKIMTISRIFSFNPTEEMTNPSESTLFRDVRKAKYIDEAEKIFYFNPKTKRVEQDNRAEIINSSYKYTGSVSRQEKEGNRFIKKTFYTYSPIMISSINGLFGATEDRAIVHITTKAPANDDRMELEPDESNPEYQAIRDELYLFLLQNWAEVENIYINLRVKTLRDRDFWLWHPLLTLAKLIDDDLFEAVKEFAEQQTSIKKIDDLNETSLDYKIIKATYNLLEGGNNEILLSDIVKTLPEAEQHTQTKTISKILDKIGFRENRKHFREGNGYLLTLPEFKEIINIQYPLFFSSLSSLSSQLLIKEENIVKMSEDKG